MHILGAGRSAFLEFLRNLTPAVLLTSLAVLLWARLDFRNIDYGNWVPTMAFFGCALTAALAFYANVSAFLDHAFSPAPGLDKAMRRLRKRGHPTRSLLSALVALTWRRQRVVFFEVVLVLVVVYAGMFGATISALNAAVAALRNGIR